jgi:hypothetical protein
VRRFAPDGPDGGTSLPARRPSSADPDAERPPLERLLRFFVAPPAPHEGPAAEWPAGNADPLVEGASCGVDPLAEDHGLAHAEPPAGLEVAPPDLRAVDHAGRTHRAPRVVVLGGAADVRAAARALAARLAALQGPAAGVLASWSAGEVPEPAREAPTRSGLLPARGGAARLATALVERGHDARAAGRLVEVRLGEEPGAVAEAERVQDAARHAPLVLALGGARGEAWDRLLAAQDLVLLAAGARVPEALASVALAITQDRCEGVPVRTVAVSAGRRPRPSRADLAALVALLKGR